MKLISICEGVAIGAGLMYILDPDRGQSRRSQLADQVQHQAATHKRAITVMEKDFQNRARGIVAEVQSHFLKSTPSDEVQEARIRSILGRLVQNSDAIEISVKDGNATLSGPVVVSQMQDVLDVIGTMNGVETVTNQLEGVPASDMHSGSPLDQNIATAHWDPAECLVAVVGGGFMALYGMAKRGPIGAVMGLLGVGLLVKGFADTELSGLPRSTPASSVENILDNAASAVKETIGRAKKALSP